MSYYNKIFSCVFLSLLAGHCAAQLQIENAWVQLAPPAATVNSAYMQISNPQLRPQTIVGLSADCCVMAMLHNTRRSGDKVSMDHLEYLTIPAQGSVQLAPGGMHIMLAEAHQELTLESKVKITFSFNDGSTQDIELDVKKTDP